MKLLQHHVNLATRQFYVVSYARNHTVYSVRLGPHMLTALVHACTGKMGAITSVVAELGEVKDKAKTFKWKEFKEYRGGVLVVSLTRLLGCTR